MRRSFGLAAVLVALSLMFPLGASAGPASGRIPPGTIVVDAPPGLVCPVATGEVIWTIVDGQYSMVDKPDGRLMEGMGISHLEVASLATGKSVVLKIAGAGSYSPDGTVVHLSGKVIWGFFPGDAGPGDQAAGRSFYFEGTQTALNAANGATIDFNYSGQIVMDVCAAIS